MENLMLNVPFSPAATATLAATTASASVSISASCSRIMVQNAGTATAFVRWGVGAQTAVVTDTPVLSGAIMVFTKANDADTFAGITASGTATVYVTSGYGT